MVVEKERGGVGLIEKDTVVIRGVGSYHRTRPRTRGNGTKLRESGTKLRVARKGVVRVFRTK